MITSSAISPEAIFPKDFTPLLTMLRSLLGPNALAFATFPKITPTPTLSFIIFSSLFITVCFSHHFTKNHLIFYRVKYYCFI
jgi:hypothetical protein